MLKALALLVVLAFAGIADARQPRDFREIWFDGGYVHVALDSGTIRNGRTIRQIDFDQDGRVGMVLRNRVRIDRGDVVRYTGSRRGVSVRAKWRGDAVVSCRVRVTERGYWLSDQLIQPFDADETRVTNSVVSR